MDWTNLYCDIDDFCQYFEPIWRSRQLATGERKRLRPSRLSTSEIITIVIAFHTSNYHHFEAFYLMLLERQRAEFPGLLSYTHQPKRPSLRMDEHERNSLTNDFTRHALNRTQLSRELKKSFDR